MMNPISKAGSVERFNRTLKSRLYKYFTLKNTIVWIDILPKIVKAINNSVNRMHGMKPADINFDNAQQVYEKMYVIGKKITNKGKTREFKAGDVVRISKERGIFEKSYLPSRTVEKFVIIKKLNRNPKVYHISDLHGDKIEGIFYDEELVKVNDG